MSSISVVALATLSFVNIVLLLGVVRRLNRLTGATPSPISLAPEREFPLPEPGTSIGEFVAATTTGERIGTKELSGWLLVGFFTVGCSACEQFQPEFRASANAFPGGRDQVLAVVAGGKGDPVPVARQFEDVARVVVEPAAGPVSTAFGVTAFPAACLLKGSVVVAAEFDMESLTDLLPAAVATG